MTLPQRYDPTEAETRWQKHWLERGTYHWDESEPRSANFVIDTPPPTVSGLLHMGHIFSYTQADFVARYQRMAGKNVFYPMGFDDNGLPTERLVEKVTKKRAVDYASREEFIEVCEGIAEEARKEFRALFESVALSVDWRQQYYTISEQSRKLSQLSFLDLYRKGHAYRALQPMFWDPVDQTAIAQAEVEDKEFDSHFNDILFEIVDENGESFTESSFLRRQEPKRSGDRRSQSRKTEGLDPSLRWDDEEGEDKPVITFRNGKSYITIGTTRPELIPACVGIFFHPEDARYAGLEGCTVITPLFGVKVPVMTDDSVEPEKGSGIMMCCTFGDKADIEKWRKNPELPTRVILNKFGKLEFTVVEYEEPNAGPVIHFFNYSDASGRPDSSITAQNCIDVPRAINNLEHLRNKKASNADPKHLGARQKVIEMLGESGDLLESRPIRHTVECAERSGSPLEIMPTTQWFVKTLDKKDALKARSKECEWHPEWMQTRMEQWIDGLKFDWCISRQRYFGVPFPIWFSKRPGEEGKILIAEPDQLPVNPLTDLPKGYAKDEVEPDRDVMDTWATSSISPQLNAWGITSSPSSLPESRSDSKAIHGGDMDSPIIASGDSGNDDAFVLDADRFSKLYPADLRPQAHEIIRTWAFYTLLKSHLHNDTIPWKNLMISGWCLAEDKTKMSKSKGNVVTPVDLILEQGADVVRYWAATSRLGADTAFSRDLLKIGKKLVTKIWNATKFAAIHLEKLQPLPPGEVETAYAVSGEGMPRAIDDAAVTEPLDRWILTRLQRAVAKATESFDSYEYSTARAAIEDFFWNDFCDNYLELVKARVYGEEGVAPTPEAMSAVHTIYHCLDGILRLFAPILPHVTEELWSHLFAESYDRCGSIHARGNWPNAADYPMDEAAEAQGIAAVEILEVVRKAKSERNVSIKYPIDEAVLSAGTDAPTLSGSLRSDLCGAGNLKQLRDGDASGGIESETGRYRIALEFAAEADAA